MGYRTTYRLEIDEGMSSKKSREDVITFLKFFYETDGYDFPFSFKYSKVDIDKFLLGEMEIYFDICHYGEELKWYNHEDEMKALSSKLPNYLFTLRGIGEDHEDIWTKYFKNGKMQYAQARIEFDEFDESKLE